MCNILLITAAAIAVVRGGFGVANNTVRIFLDNVLCVGSEEMLLDCRHSTVGAHNCGHMEDAGVICQGQMSTSGKWALLYTYGSSRELDLS